MWSIPNEVGASTLRLLNIVELKSATRRLHHELLWLLKCPMDFLSHKPWRVMQRRSEQNTESGPVSMRTPTSQTGSFQAVGLWESESYCCPWHVGIIMINYPVWISPSGQVICMVDSKGWIFEKTKPGKIWGRHLILYHCSKGFSVLSKSIE